MSHHLSHLSANQVTIIGAVVNLVLALGKILAGIMGHSQALIVDGIHSLSDLLSDFIVVFAIKFASKKADADHPYGHERIETVATAFLGLLLLLTAIAILFDTLQKMIRHDNILQPEAFALIIAMISILSKEILFQYTIKVANRLDSSLLRANAWHHRTDAISSVVVLLGIAGSLMGFQYLDTIAALIVALMIMGIAWELLKPSIMELIDTALDEAQIQEIKALILDIDGVLQCHLLRTRIMAGKVLVDVHVMVNSDITVSEGHHIAEQLKCKLIKELEQVTDVMVHIDSEDDEINSSSEALPSRTELINGLTRCWQDVDFIHLALEKMRIHYIDGVINLEIFLPLSLLQQHSATIIKGQLYICCQQDNGIEQIEIFYY